MEAAFASVFQSVKVLDLRLSTKNSDSTCTVPVAELINYLCLQCEASLQFLQTLCQQKAFRERLLRNKVPYTYSSFNNCVARYMLQFKNMSICQLL